MAATDLLTGKTALVTGAAKRLGRATALGLARRGVRIVAHYGRSEAEARSLADEVNALGVECVVVQGDLAKPESAGDLFEQACDAAGPVDILVNNASEFPESRLDTFSVADMHRNADINALAPAMLVRAMAARKRPGHVINLLDCRIVDYDETHVAYHLSKRMLYALTRMMAVEYAPRLHVNAVAPGLVLPPEGKDASYLAERAHTNPLEAHGDADDITRTVLFLLDSPFITGQVVFVDGGRHLLGNFYGC
jgi:hypothetical protein